MTGRESPEAHATENRRSGTAMLLYALLGPATIWFLSLNVQYALTHLACTTRVVWPLHVVALLALGGTLSGGVVGLRRWRRSNASRTWSGGEADAAEDAGPAELDRRRLVAILAMPLSVLFSMLVVMQWLPIIIFHPCQQ